ncbi:MAG: biotin/lipoyl-binding protein, partial [Minisyncoccia bacterium]
MKHLFFVPISKYAKAHKFITFLIAAAILGGGYYVYGKLNVVTTETRYILASASRETIVSSVSGTGQVSVSNQFDIKPQVSGNIVAVKVGEGQAVKAGTLLFQIDSTDAEKSVRDAQANLESAQIALDKLEQPADALSLIQAENALAQAKQSKQSAQDDLIKTYDDSFNSISNAFTDLPGIVTGLENILYGNDLNKIQGNVYSYYNMINNYKPNADQFRDIAISSYQDARTVYDQNLQDYKNTDRMSDQNTINNLVAETYQTS